MGAENRNRGRVALGVVWPVEKLIVGLKLGT